MIALLLALTGITMTTPHKANAADLADPTCTTWKPVTASEITFQLKRNGEDYPIQWNTAHSVTTPAIELSVFPVGLNAMSKWPHESCVTGDGTTMYRITGKKDSTTSFTETLYPTINGRLRYHISITTDNTDYKEVQFLHSSNDGREVISKRYSMVYDGTGKNSLGLLLLKGTSDPSQAYSGYDAVSGTNDIILDIANINKNNDRLVTLDANGGTMPDGSPSAPVIINATDISTLDWAPTRPGYRLKGWTVNKDGTGGSAVDLKTAIKDEQTLYAQWEKDTGRPTAVHISCANGGASTCAVSTDYKDAESRTRVLTTASTGANLAWDKSGPIDGVLLDDSGYRARSSCVPMSTGPAKCYWVSLKDKPDTTTDVNLNNVPVTGAPASDWLWPAVCVTVVLAGIRYGLKRRRRA